MQSTAIRKYLSRQLSTLNSDHLNIINTLLFIMKYRPSIWPKTTPEFNLIQKHIYNRILTNIYNITYQLRLWLALADIDWIK